MYKLTVISGPTRGASFPLSDGENPIGRKSGNVVVLRSSKISRVHCIVRVSGDTIEVEDQQSSNGTYINGTMVKIKTVKPGDRIGVGEYVLEIQHASRRHTGEVPALADLHNVIALPVHKQIYSGPAPLEGLGGQLAIDTSQPPPQSESPLPDSQPVAAPKEFFEKLKFHFENYIMPFFYGLLTKYDWKILSAAIVGIFISIGLYLTLHPIMTSGDESVLKESGRRARFMAKLIAELNTPILAKGEESSTTVSLVEDEFAVRIAVLIDMESRIIAPANQTNQYLTTGDESRFARKMAALFQEGRETGMLQVIRGGSTIVAVEPVKVFNRVSARNEPIAMAIVSVDTSLSIRGMGESAVIYARAIVVLLLLGTLTFLILYRMTLKPFETLNEDMDKVLKGELNEVTKDFKFSELKSLLEIIDSSLQRVSRSSDTESGGPLDTNNIGWEELGQCMSLSCEHAGIGFAICDPDNRLRYTNSFFEDITGVRASEGEGHDLASLARDDAFRALVEDLFRQVRTADGPVTEGLEFNGIMYSVSCTSLGSPIQKATVILIEKKEEDLSEA